MIKSLCINYNMYKESVYKENYLLDNCMILHSKMKIYVYLLLIC